MKTLVSLMNNNGTADFPGTRVSRLVMLSEDTHRYQDIRKMGSVAIS